jgi:outer membrane protein, multidrug efflux system
VLQQLRLLGGVAAATLTACTVGPNYRPPALETPPAFQQVPQTKDLAPISQANATEADLSQWWTQFHDQTLTSLVERALRFNLDLQTAASRIRQAREQVIIAGASEWPSINATGSAARLHSNSNPLASLGGTSGATSTNLKFFSLGFDATWEIDLFGGTRRSVEAAHASAEAAEWQLRDAQVSLSAEVAIDYLALRAAQSRIAILRSSIAHQQDLLQLATARAQGGLTTELDVNQQRAQLASDQAKLPDLEAQETAMIHALGVLLGGQPDALAGELTEARALPVVPQTLPVGLPSDLLRRRADIRNAERQLAAATAQIGAAVAQLYPKFDLIAAPLFVKDTASGLLTAQQFTDLELGLIQWPVFEAGKLRANVRAHEEQQRQAYLAYQQAVLGALRDAEDALTRYAAAQRTLLALEEAESSAQSSLQIAEQQYQTGTVDFLNVLSANTTLLDTQDQTAQSQQALAQALVSVYKALGGGWDATAITQAR